MVSEHERAIAIGMVEAGHWRLERSLFRCTQVVPVRFKALHELLLRRQRVDDFHHAPCCPANHWHRRILVFHTCSCGAAEARR